MKPLQSPQKKKILAQLNEQFGIQELHYLLLQFGKEKIRLYSGSLSKEELITLDKTLRIENIGLYSINQQQEELRLTLDGIQLFKNQITKNILPLTNQQSDKWFKGNDLDIQTSRGFVVLANNREFIGCGKSTGDRITNFVPKERRVKS